MQNGTINGMMHGMKSQVALYARFEQLVSSSNDDLAT